MARYEAKTVENDGDVDAFLASVEHPVRRRDGFTLRELYERVTGEPARMWGPAIVGFGYHRYEYASGHSGEVGAAGFSPRKNATTVYLMDGPAAYAEDLERLGPHTASKACLYLKDLEKVVLEVLASIVERSFRKHHMERPA